MENFSLELVELVSDTGKVREGRYDVGVAIQYVVY